MLAVLHLRQRGRVDVGVEADGQAGRQRGLDGAQHVALPPRQLRRRGDEAVPARNGQEGDQHAVSARKRRGEWRAGGVSNVLLLGLRSTGPKEATPTASGACFTRLRGRPSVGRVSDDRAAIKHSREQEGARDEHRGDLGQRLLGRGGLDDVALDHVGRGAARERDAEGGAPVEVEGSTHDRVRHTTSRTSYRWWGDRHPHDGHHRRDAYPHSTPAKSSSPSGFFGLRCRQHKTRSAQDRCTDINRRVCRRRSSLDPCRRANGVDHTQTRRTCSRLRCACERA